MQNSERMVKQMTNERTITERNNAELNGIGQGLHFEMQHLPN